jgi:anti-sigma factor RsiW
VKNGSLPPVSDEDLHGFVDGETPPAGREAILAFLSASPAEAARVEKWRRQNEALRAAFARVEAEHIPLSWLMAPAPKRRGFPCKLLSKQERPAKPEPREPGARPSAQRSLRPVSLLAAGFAFGMIAGIAASLIIARFLAPERAPAAGTSQTQGSAESDAVFVSRTVSALLAFAPPPASAQAADPTPDPAGAGQLPTAMILPHLAGTGLRLAGVRVAPGESEQMFCLFYAKSLRAAVALCVEKATGLGPTGFRKAGHFPSAAIAWRQSGANYAIAGALPETELRTLAERARDEVDAFANR